MRDPNRIPGVLACIEALWRKSPDLRLGQLLVNLTRGGIDLFHLEDDALTERALAAIVGGDAE